MKKQKPNRIPKSEREGVSVVASCENLSLPNLRESITLPILPQTRRGDTTHRSFPTIMQSFSNHAKTQAAITLHTFLIKERLHPSYVYKSNKAV